MCQKLIEPIKLISSNGNQPQLSECWSTNIKLPVDIRMIVTPLMMKVTLHRAQNDYPSYSAMPDHMSAPVAYSISQQ